MQDWKREANRATANGASEAELVWTQANIDSLMRANAANCSVTGNFYFLGIESAEAVGFSRFRSKQGSFLTQGAECRMDFGGRGSWDGLRRMTTDNDG
jgi:hypothetical protein